MQQFFLNVIRGVQTPLQPPVDNMDEIWNTAEKEMAQSNSKITLLGSKDSIRKQLTGFQEKYDVQEIMVVSYIFDPDKQKRSYEILKEVVDEE